MKKLWIGVGLACAVIMFSGCGGGGGGGWMELEIEDARKPADIELPNPTESGASKATNTLTKSGIDPLQVSLFRVTITGEGIEEPMITEADANAEQIQILEITPGLRDVLIEAFNGREEVIRRRLIEDVIIKAGVVTPLKTALNTIPLVLNYRDNAVVLADYFRIYGFGEPEATLDILSTGVNHDLNLCLNVAGDELVISPDKDTGLFEHIPETFAIGKQDLILTDTTNGESSSKPITLVNANNRPGFRFVTAGSVGKIVTIGTGFGAVPDNNYPLVMMALTTQ